MVKEGEKGWGGLRWVREELVVEVGLGFYFFYVFFSFKVVEFIGKMETLKKCS